MMRVGFASIVSYYFIDCDVINDLCDEQVSYSLDVLLHKLTDAAKKPICTRRRRGYIK